MCACVCVCVCMHACVHVCMCVHTTYVFVWFSVSNSVFVYVNDFSVKMSSCKQDLVFSTFKEVITHQAQEPTMREFCPSGSSCYNCTHDLSLSLNIVRIPTFPMWYQSLKTYIRKPSYDKYDKSLQHSNDWPLSWPSSVLPKGFSSSTHFAKKQ